MSDIPSNLPTLATKTTTLVQEADKNANIANTTVPQTDGQSITSQVVAFASASLQSIIDKQIQLITNFYDMGVSLIQSVVNTVTDTVTQTINGAVTIMNMVTTSTQDLINMGAKFLVPPTPKETDPGVTSNILSLPATNDKFDYKELNATVKANQELTTQTLTDVGQSLTTNSPGGADSREIIRYYEKLDEHPIYSIILANSPGFLPVSECIGFYVNYAADTTGLDQEYWANAVPIRYTVREKMSTTNYMLMYNAYSKLNINEVFNMSNEYWNISLPRELTRNPVTLMPIGPGGEVPTPAAGGPGSLNEILSIDPTWAYAPQNLYLGDMFWSRYITRPELQVQMITDLQTAMGIQTKLINHQYPVSTSEVAMNDSYNITIDGETVGIDRKGNIRAKRDLLNNGVLNG
jgi:hypothetical protein